MRAFLVMVTFLSVQNVRRIMVFAVGVCHMGKASYLVTLETDNQGRLSNTFSSHLAFELVKKWKRKENAPRGFY